jgi:hypothetical protein
VFENGVLNRVFGSKRAKVKGRLEKIASRYILRRMESRRLKWAEHVAYMGKRRSGYMALV